MKATGEKGVDVSLDTVGASLFEQSLRCLGDNGRHIAIASLEPRVSFDLVAFYRKQARILGVNTLKLNDSQSAAILGDVVALISAGHLQAPNPKTIKLDQALDAYEQIHTGKLKGKVVITFDHPKDRTNKGG